MEPCLFRALIIESFAPAKLTTTHSYQDHLPASLVSDVEPCLFRALIIESFASAKPTTGKPSLHMKAFQSQSYQASLLRFAHFPRGSLTFFAPLKSLALLQQSFPRTPPSKITSPASLISHVEALPFSCPQNRELCSSKASLT